MTVLKWMSEYATSHCCTSGGSADVALPGLVVGALLPLPVPAPPPAPRLPAERCRCVAWRLSAPRCVEM